MKQQFVLALGLFMMISCTSADKDVTAPVLEILSWEPMPVEAEVCGTLEPGVFTLRDSDSLVCLVRMQDESGLSEFKIDIHENFDCHGHRDQTRDWLLQQIIPLGGTLFQDRLVIYPPANATAGLYHFSIQVSDVFGNVNAGYPVFSVQLQNSQDTILPELSVAQPAGNSIQSTRGQTLVFEGSLDDNRSLASGGNAGVELRFRSLQSTNVFRGAMLDLSGETEPMVDFSLPWTVPLSLPVGTYELQIRGMDGVRNLSALRTYMLEVIP
jgi:hypothetical protein